MDVKKKNLWENFRLKTKLANLKKPRKKALANRPRGLAHRRSISVPDLLFVPGGGCSRENILSSTTSDIHFFGVSPGESDSDSIASGSNAEGLTFNNKLTDSNPEIQHTDNQAGSSSYRMSAPVEMLNLYDEITNNTAPCPERRLNLTPEGLYTQVDKTSRGQRFSFEPIPAPRHVLNVTQESSPRLDDSSENNPAESKPSSETVAALLARAQSMAEFQTNEKRSVEPKKCLSEKGSTQVRRAVASADRWSLKLDIHGAPLESADGTSLDSACGTPSEEQVYNPWTDSEELEREAFSPMMMKDFSMDDGLMERVQTEEALEESGEVNSEICDFFEENLQDPLGSSEVLTTGPEVPLPAPSQRYLLNINLKQGRNLVIRDKRSGTSDPYVKFKLEGKQFYKSKVVYKSLNPRWNESFSHPLRDREHMVDVRVYNKNRTADEFMGSSCLSLKNLDLYRTYEMELKLNDPKSKEDDMGAIIVDICLMYRDATIKRSPRWPARKMKQQNQPPLPQRPADIQKNQLKNQMWSGVLAITLVEGQDIPAGVQGDIYVRFRLADQKYKSKNLCIQANPQWREQFDFNQFEENQEPLQVELFAKRGRKNEESWGIFEVDVSRLPLNERQLYTHVLDPGKGRLVFLVSLRPCWGVSISDIETATLTKSDERDAVVEKFSLRNSHKSMRDVGFLQVNILKANDLSATDLNGKSNPVCVVELGNCKLQTHTVYKTLNPEWNKAVTFPIKDIHDVVEFTVFNENGDKAPDFIGKVAIPLLSVQNGQQICLFLKKENMGRVSKGTITLVLEVIYNKVRAGIKTFQPKEVKLTEENLKFSKKILSRNIYRVRKLSTAVLYTLRYIKSCFQWESTQRSLIAFLIFLVSVWNCELFMLPLFLLLLIGWNYFHLSSVTSSSNQDLVNMTMGDDEEEDEKDSGKKGLMEKIHMVQEVVLVVQNVLEEIANIGERIKNIFNWSVPFMSCLSCLVLFAGAVLLYFVPLRYVVLIWGVNKFTKKLRNPYTIDSNEILDFLQRVPSDVQKVQHTALRAPSSQNQPRRRK